MRMPRPRFSALAACVASIAAAHLWFASLLPLTAQAGRSFELEEITIASLLAEQQAGRQTARSIAESYLSRIQTIDRAGPTLRSVIEVNPDALAIADVLDAARRATGLRGP